MNWYKESQLYEDIENFPEEFGDNLDAHLYFSIGQNEETHNDSYCWIWKNRDLLINKGPTTHRMSFGQDVDNYYRGWYDPVQQMISIVPPERKWGDKKVPAELLTQLKRKFKENAQIKVF